MPTQIVKQWQTVANNSTSFETEWYQRLLWYLPSSYWYSGIFLELHLSCLLSRIYLNHWRNYLNRFLKNYTCYSIFFVDLGWTFHSESWRNIVYICKILGLVICRGNSISTTSSFTDIVDPVETILLLFN